MPRTKSRYSNFWDRINVDAFEQAINWSPEYSQKDNDIGFCPFPENHSHGDTTGKFAIHREKRVYNCWACGGGSLLSLAMELMDLSVEEATAWLYQFTEEDMRTDNEFADEFLDAFRDMEKRLETLPYFNQRVLEKFDEPIPQEWLDSRHISERTAALFGVRYSSTTYRGKPRNARFEDDTDYEGPAIIFPHHYQERLVGWQSRWLDDDRPEWVPKYTMTSDFPKETTLYGWDNIRGGGAEQIFVVESVPSVLFLRTLGFQAVATFGSSVSEPQMRLLRRISSGVILARDNDLAGEKWSSLLAGYLKRYIPIFELPIIDDTPGSDVGDLAENRHPEAALGRLLNGLKEVGIDL